MTIKVKMNLVSEAKYGLECPNHMDAEYITIHNTANDASEKLAIKFVAQLLKERIVSANIKTGTASIVRTVFCQREEGTRLRLPSKQN